MALVELEWVISGHVFDLDGRLAECLSYLHKLIFELRSGGWVGYGGFGLGLTEGGQLRELFDLVPDYFKVVLPCRGLASAIESVFF